MIICVKQSARVQVAIVKMTVVMGDVQDVSRSYIYEERPGLDVPSRLRPFCYAGQLMCRSPQAAVSRTGYGAQADTVVAMH